MRILSDGTSMGTELYDDNGVKLDPFNYVVKKIEWEITAPDDAKVILHIFEDENSTENIGYFPIGKISLDVTIKPENVKVITE